MRHRDHISALHRRGPRGPEGERWRGRFAAPDDTSGGFAPSHPDRLEGRGGMGRRGGGRGGRRPFNYGELRLLVLALISEKPRHGYELIKAIEDRLQGSYAPSPGVIYPTLAWFEDMAYAVCDLQGAERKCYSITPEGEAYLRANQAHVTRLLQLEIVGNGQKGTDDPLRDAMTKLKRSLRVFSAIEPDSALVEDVVRKMEALAQQIAPDLPDEV